MAKRALGKDVFKEESPRKRRKLLKEELKPRGQVKVSLLLTPEDVEKVENLQLLLNQKGSGRYTKSEIVRMAIRKLSADNFGRIVE